MAVSRAGPEKTLGISHPHDLFAANDPAAWKIWVESLERSYLRL
jgi:hypothetical protein